jgi:hypothetical protein
MAWKGFGAGPFNIGRTFHPQSNFDTSQDEGNQEDDNTCAIDELLAEAGTYDGAV